MTPAERMERDCERQGIPARLTDPVLIEKAAALFAVGRCEAAA